MLSFGISALAYGSYFPAPGLDIPPDIRMYLRLATLLTAVIPIGLLVKDNKRATSINRVARPTLDPNSGVTGWDAPARQYRCLILNALPV